MSGERLSTEKAQIQAHTLFEREPCRCCDCCDGYCPDQEDRADRWSELYAVTVHGREYVTDRYIMVAREMLDGLPEDVVNPLPGTPKTDWAILPSERPEPSQRPQSAPLLDRLTRAGITVHEGERAVNLYYGAAHVGWALWAKRDGVAPADLPLVREVAREAGIDIRAAALAMHVVRAALSTSPGPQS